MKIKIIALLCFTLLLSCSSLSSLIKPGPSPGEVVDEARHVNRTASSFPAADEDFFSPMDGGINLEPQEVQGRNTWIIWTGGMTGSGIISPKPALAHLIFSRPCRHIPV